MKLPTNPLVRSLMHALGVLAYAAFAATIMFNGEALFGDRPSIWGPISFLMLFVLSAAMVGSLIFARPVIMFINGEKKEAVNFLSLTIAWLAILTSLILLSRALI